MISDFLTTDWGRLCDGDRCVLSSGFTPAAHISFSDACVIFKPGKQRDGWFSANDLLTQVDHMIDIFKGLTKGWAQGLFLFDNAPSHQKHADDTISALQMVKGACNRSLQACADMAHTILAPKAGRTHHLGGQHMRCGTLPTGEPQPFYFPQVKGHPMSGWFKGMEVIIWECGLWPEAGLPAQCKDFKCLANHTDCCCRHLLLTQPDFTDEKSQLQEHIESCGHLCDFYLKYHCKLNFIEQYWGAAKFQYHAAT
jgi:hypothetical protein